MFYLIHFDMESKETQQLRSEWSGSPNGTIVSFAQHIRSSLLPADQWIIWLEQDIVDRHRSEYERLATLNGIKSVTELKIQHSIHDAEWRWEDTYIYDVFSGVI